MMKYSEQFMEHIEYVFAAFCRIVLRNAALNAYLDFRQKKKREVSLDYLMSKTSFEPFTTDNYFEQYKPTTFVVKGQKVTVVSERLADALSKLSEQRRTVLLMYSFWAILIQKSGKSTDGAEVQLTTGNYRL